MLCRMCIRQPQGPGKGPHLELTCSNPRHRGSLGGVCLPGLRWSMKAIIIHSFIMLKEPEAFFPWFSWKREGFGNGKAEHSPS